MPNFDDTNNLNADTDVDAGVEILMGNIVEEDGGGGVTSNGFTRNLSVLSDSSTGGSYNEDDDAQQRLTQLQQQQQEDDTFLSGTQRSIGGGGAGAIIPSKAVDWIPQQPDLSEEENIATLSSSGIVSQLAIREDDVTETSFTTLTTIGEQQQQQQRAASAVAAGAMTTTRVGSRLRSPRPAPRPKRAVDWCPSVGGGNSTGGQGGGGANNVLSSDKTAVTARAVRLGDDATITTFATMTTMGDAGSVLLLEENTEDEASDSSGGGGNASSSGVYNLEEEGEDEEDEDITNNDDNNTAKALKPTTSHYRTNTLKSKNSATTTNRAVLRGTGSSPWDDQLSVMTFTTLDGTNHQVYEDDKNEDVVVDKVPSSMTPSSSSLLQPMTINNDGTASMVTTNAIVPMGDNQSLAAETTSWNTMGGQLTGNVVDHVPVMNLSYDDSANTDEEGKVNNEVVGGDEEQTSSSNITVYTSNAIKDDSSVLTLVTSTAYDDGDNLSVINEVVDNIPIFAGGGGGRSIASGITNQAVRLIPPHGGGRGGGGGDDRSVASYGTMTTMGDLGSIVEIEENLENEDDYEGMVVSGYHQQIRSRLLSSLPASLVDAIPESTPSVASGTTNRSVRGSVGEEYDDSASMNTFDTGRVGFDGNEMNRRSTLETYTSGITVENDELATLVDHVPTYPTDDSASIVTNRAVKSSEDQSVATWVTSTTGAVLGSGRMNEHVVDNIPSFSADRHAGVDSATEEEEWTNCAVKDPEDQSVATWNTMQHMPASAWEGGARSASVMSPLSPYAVDRVPSYLSRGLGMGVSLSGNTNHAIRAGGGDDQSVVTFATMTTVGGGGMDRGGIGEGDADIIVDKIPLSIPPHDVETTSIVTDQTVRMGDNQSLATWGTTNTMGRQLLGNVVDHVPSFDDEDMTVGTTNAMKEDRSITTFTTSTAYGGISGIDEVVDNIPTFAGGDGQSLMSGVTNQAIRSGDDRSVLTFATMTDYESGRYSDNLVDHIPALSDSRTTTSILSGSTDHAVRLGDDEATFATMTTAAAEEGYPSSAPAEVDSYRNLGITSLSGGAVPPATVLRSALRSRSQSGSSVGPLNEILPIDAGESVSNTHILRAIADLRFHMDYRIVETRELNRRDSDRVLQIVQQEQAKRTALESRLHSQLLLQSESMVAMELKLLRLEAKVGLRDTRPQRRQTGIYADRLPPIAATPSTPNQSDEEVDSFDELELTPRGTNRHVLGSGMFTHGGIMQRSGGPENIAVVTRYSGFSGASVASAVTANTFPEGDDTNANDGDIEDEVSDAPLTQNSRTRISNLESILLNPVRPLVSFDQGISTRAVRGEIDGNSTLQTSVTSATMASTVVTSTTRGNESIGITQIISRASEEDTIPEGIVEQASMLLNSDDLSAEVVDQSDRQPRSRSQSPLTVQSAATGFLSVASASLGPSILTTSAVAPSRSFGTRRANAAAAIANAEVGRSMANRVVSFTTNDMFVGAPSPQPMQENDGGGDSITMPDELDTFSDIADAFSNSARVWREEYEARLDAIHKRLGN